MLPKSLITIGFCSLMSANIALANDVVTWQDDNGVTHFGNAQFAPAGQGDEVRLQPANAMQVPGPIWLCFKRRKVVAGPR